MPKLKTRPPRLSRDRKVAVIWVDGQRLPMGRWGSEEAQEAYDRFIAEWLMNGRKSPAADEPEVDSITITEVLVEYTRWSNKRYTASEAHTIRMALRVLRSHYGSTPAAKFGPKRLAAVRQAMVEKGWARSYINKQASRIRAAFRWAASQELVDDRIYRRLETLGPLTKGEATKEGRKINPVPQADIRRVWPHLTKPIKGLILLQLLTAARADELVRLRATDIDMSGDVWTATLVEHKTSHHGKARTLYFGPRGQRVLRQFIGTGKTLTAPLFSPRESNAEAKRRDAAGQRRKNQKPNPTAESTRWKNQHGEGERNTPRQMADHYSTTSYRRVIHRACSKAGVDRWSPHRLRHSAATAIRREFGVEIARLVLGHAHLNTTEIYAEADAEKVRGAIAKIG